MAINSTESSASSDGAVPAKGLSFRALAIGAFLLLLIGLVGGGWAMNRLLSSNSATPVAKGAGTPAADGVLTVTGDVVADSAAAAANRQQPLVVAPIEGANALAARIVELEQRLSRITLEAASASGNASRAEGLLVAFAARRALDRGLSLGYLDAQLRLRFGDAQPNAVKTIIDTARDPVTLEQLRAGLEALAPQLVGRSDGGGSLWTGIRRELGELFVVRAAGTLSPRSADRLERARRNLAGEQVDKAIDEVEALPGAEAASEWLMDARRYHEARRALDLVETAAILEPRDSAPPAD